MSKNPEQMRASMIENLPENTGRTLPEWLDLVGKQGLSRHGEIVQWLKEEHGLSHGYANLITHESRNEGGGDTPEHLVENQYAGPKHALRPIYDTLVGIAERLGDDVEVSPKKTYVSLCRGRQFAIIQATNTSRVDLGLKLPDTEATDRLEPAGSFNAMVTHRVALEDPIEIDSEVKGWLEKAYELAG